MGVLLGVRPTERAGVHHHVRVVAPQCVQVAVHKDVMEVMVSIVGSL